MQRQQQQQQMEYKYLKPSVKVNGEFDLRFDKIKNSTVTQGLLAGWTFLKYKLFNKSEKVYEPSSKEDKELLEKELPVLKPNLTHEHQTKIRYTWIGHSTAVIQVGQDNLLIDPVFSTRCSPSQYIGHKRYRPPACSVKELGKIDLVLVSHDHYDHLDVEALNQLHKLYNPIFIAGIGSLSVFPSKCRMLEMDWMNQAKFTINGREYEVIFVPVCHWSRRGAFDFNTRLWGGFVIKTPHGQRIFYSGDTAYTEVFKEIGHKYGPFDLAILPIGAYQPREFLSPMHVDPKEAVQIHKDLRSIKSVGVHWGTFPLGFEGFLQPREDLQKAKKELQVEKDAFVTIYHGESITL